MDDGIPFEGGQELLHLVCDVVYGLYKKVPAAHGRVEHFQVEEGDVERRAILFVGLVFGGITFGEYSLLSQGISLVVLGCKGLFGLVKDWAQCL